MVVKADEQRGSALPTSVGLGGDAAAEDISTAALPLRLNVLFIPLAVNIDGERQRSKDAAVPVRPFFE